MHFNIGKLDSRLLIAFNYQVIKVRVRVLKLSLNLTFVHFLWSEIGIWPELSQHQIFLTFAEICGKPGVLHALKSAGIG